jgi:hypothetical protein
MEEQFIRILCLLAACPGLYKTNPALLKSLLSPDDF